MIIAIVIISILLIVSVYVNINQIRRQESQEDYITELENSNTEYYNFFQQLRTKVGEANSQIRNADRLGAFEASDEVGASFNIIKEVFEDLNKGF
jgi:peptidoglycan hydrolase CwlO-like protein